MCSARDRAATMAQLSQSRFGIAGEAPALLLLGLASMHTVAMLEAIHRMFRLRCMTIR